MANDGNLKRFHTEEQEHFFNSSEGYYLGSKQCRTTVWNPFLSVTGEDYGTHANTNPYFINALRYGSYRQIPQ
jgi:hypothetical protein